MKTTKKLLTLDEKSLISDLYNSELWAVLEKLWKNEYQNILNQIASSQFDQQFYQNQGRLAEILKFLGEIPRIHREYLRDKEKKNKIKE